MPRIRPYESQVSSQGDMPGRSASTQDFGGPGLANLGQGIENLGASAGQAQRIINEDIKRQKTQASHIAVQKVLAENQLEALQAEDERRKRARPDAAGHVDEAITYGKNQSETAITKIIEDPSSPILLGDYDNVRMGILQNAHHVTLEASRFAASTNAKYQVQQVGDTVTTLQNITQANPSMMAGSLLRLEDLESGITMIDGQAKRTLFTGLRQDIIGSSMDGHVDAVAKLHNPEAIQNLRTQFEDKANIWQRESNPKAYAHAMDRLNVLEASERSQRDILAASARKEMRDEAATGVENRFDPVASAAYEQDPAKRILLEKDGRAAVHTGRAVREMMHGSFEQQVAALSSGVNALSTSGNFHEDVEIQQAREAAFANRMQRIKNDLASEVLKNTAVQQAYKEMSPDVAGSIDRYVRANEAETKRIAPWREPVLLTQAQVGDIKAKLGFIDAGPQGADTALKILGGERAQWGAHWPVVLRQLTQEDALSGDQAVAARMAQDPTKEPDARLLLATGQIKPDAIDKLPGMPPGSRTQMRELIQSELDPVRQALVGQVGGMKELARYQQATEILATGYMLRGETNIKVATEKAARSVIKDDFHWAGDYPVPLKYDPELIQRGAKAEVQGLPVSSDLPVHVVPPHDLRGLRQADIQSAMDDHLRNKARWIVNAAGTGLTLTWETGETVMMKRPDGSVSPYSVTYDQLSLQGTAVKSDAKQAGATKVPNAY